jgi:acyl-CoA thioesterase
MSVSPLTKILDPVPTDPGVWAFQLTDDWHQGRGAYGGIVMALFVRAMEEELGATDCPIRVLDCQFIQSVQAGPVHIRVEKIREGINVSFLGAKMTQNGNVMAAASATFARKRDLKESFDFRAATMPDVPPPEKLPVAPTSGSMPQFTERFEFRYAHGSFPFTGSEQAEMGTWLRLTEPHPNDAVQVCLLIDVLPPAIFTTFRSFSPAATVTISCSFLEPMPLLDVGDDPAFLVVSQTQRGHEGYSFETNDLWSEDGRLVARARQMVVHIDPPRGR